MRAIKVKPKDELESTEDIVTEYLAVLGSYGGMSRKDQKVWAKRWIEGGGLLALQRLVALEQEMTRRATGRDPASAINRHIEGSLETMALMRRQMIALDDDAYEELTKQAEALWSQACAFMKVRLAYLFPHQEQWGNDAIDALPDYTYYKAYHKSDIAPGAMKISAYALMFASGADKEHMLLCAKKAATFFIMRASPGKVA